MDGDKNLDFVNVAIRIKPLPKSQWENTTSIKIVSTDPPVILVPEKQQTFAFDHIFSDDGPSQEVVYNQMVKPLLKNVINGYNSTIFAYGQTGTGKTYTIGSGPNGSDPIDAGLISRALNDIMTFNENHEVAISISFYEIYNERVYDLLGISKDALQVKGFNINGLTKHAVATSNDARHLLFDGGKNRHTGETKQNAKSSRSHAIFTIYCNVKHLNHETDAKLNLVDLAGSESVKKTGNEGSQFHEGININKGLLCIGQVINALSNNHAYVPYRQSTITTILQDSLNKKNYVTLIACIGTNVDDLTETVQTLDFAQRAKRVRNRPELNSIISDYSQTIQKAVRNTPFKSSKSDVNLFRTPRRVHSRAPQTNISNSQGTIGPGYHNDALSMSSGSSIAQELPGSLAPMIKTCIDAAENRFIERLTTIVNDIATPLPFAHANGSPRISRRSLQREVEKIIQTNMCVNRQFCTFRNEINRRGDTSTNCVDDDDGVKEADKATHAYLGEDFKTSLINIQATPMFKEPLHPIRKKRRKVPATSSPIEQHCSPLITPKPRRSTRLSHKPARYNSPTIVAVKQGVRRSVRISNVIQRDAISPGHSNPVVVVQRCRISRISKGESFEMTPKKPIKVMSTPKNKKPNKCGPDLMDKSHTKKVVKILNTGNIKDIMELHSIGAKSAAMMLQFRQMKGKIHKVSDLQIMPWRGNGYRRFLESNFLTPNTP